MIKKFSLAHFIFLGLFLGILTGALLGRFGPVTALAAFFSDIFLKLLRMVIVPLVMTSIVSGMVGIGAGQVGRLGLKTFGYYISTSLLAILTGLFIVNLVGPGTGADVSLHAEVARVEAAEGALSDVLRRMVPDNVFSAMAGGEILPLIFFCILLGLFITRLREEHREPLARLFKAGFEVMMKITRFVMLLAPVGVWGILTKIVAETGFSAFKPLGLYALCVLAGLAVHAFVTLPLILRLVAKKRPLRLFRAQSPALMTAFSTASSSATLPLTMDCIENRAGVSNKTSSFVLPLGATINMDGTALYECVAVMFIAQAYGVELSMTQQMTVVVTALLASIGAAAIPMAGLVMMTIVLTAVGLPLEGVGLILAVDRPLDMCRTTVNVWSDSCGTAAIAVLEGEKGILERP